MPGAGIGLFQVACRGQGGGGGSSLLLEIVPGAAAAFSTRKLRTAYAGSAMRVRRDSDNSEQDIGFSGTNLDTAGLLSFVAANSAYVTKWYDQSGNARDVAQTNAASQPRIVNSGVIDTDASGKPAPTYDATDDFLISSAFSGGEIAQPNTYFSVAQLSVANGVARVLTDGDAGRNLVQTTSTYRLFAGTLVSGGTIDTSQHVISTLYNGASSILRQDGVAVIEANPGADSIDLLVIGASDTAAQPWAGPISEVIFYDTDQSANFAAVEQNQAGHFTAVILA